MTSTMIKVNNGKNNISHIDINLFTHVYKRHTNFSKDYLITNISDNIFGNNIRLNINTNYGDYLNNIILKLTLPNLKLTDTRITAINAIELSTLNTNLQIAKNNLTKFELYTKNIFICFRLIKNKLNENNLKYLELKDYINNLIINEKELNNYNEVKQNVNDNILTDNINIILIIINYINTLHNNDIDKIISVNDIRIINNKLDIIINNTNIIHKLNYYDKYNSLLQEKNQLLNNNYNFAWIKKIGLFIIKEASISINNKKIETIYADWINIWNELTSNINTKNGLDILYGDVTDLTDYNNFEKPSYDIFLQLKFWFNRKNNLFFPLLYLTHENIHLDISFRKLQDCIYTDYPNINDIKINNTKIIYEYLFLDNDEKYKIMNYDYNYYNIINIVNQYQTTLNINSLFNTDDNQYDTVIKLQLSDPVSGIYIIIKSKYLTETLKLFYNYNGIKNEPNNINNIYYSLDKNTIPILNNISINIDNLPFKNNIDVEYFNYISQYNMHSSNNNNSIYFIPFSLFSENSQPSGHINLTSDNLLEIKLQFNPTFIQNLLQYSSNDNIIINIYSNEYKEFKIKNGYYLI